MSMSEEHRQKIRESAKRTWQSKVAAGWVSPRKGKPNPQHSEAMKKKYQEDPEYRELITSHLRSEAVRDSIRASDQSEPRPKQSATMRKRYAEDPEYRSRVAAQLRSVAPSAEAQSERSGKLFREYYSDPENVRRLAERKSAWWNDPEEGAARKERMGETAGVTLARYAERRKPGQFTDLEKKLYALLDEAGTEYTAQQPIGRKVVDAWIPEYALAIEVDGEYWHQDLAKDIARDTYLAGKGVARICHISGQEIRTLTCSDLLIAIKGG